MIVAVLLLLVGLLLIVATGFYVAAEFSLVTVDRSAVTQRANAGDKSAAALLRGLKSLSTLLSGAQVGITVTTLVLGWVMEPSLGRMLGGPLRSLGLSEGAAATVAGIISLVVATVLSMVFGELVPKSLAMARPFETASRVVTGMRWSTVVLKPLIWVLDKIANSVLRVVGIEPQEELRSARSPDELRLLVRRSASLGTLAEDAAGLLARSLAFVERTAADVLTPRPRVEFVAAGATAAEVLASSARTGFSRFPVYAADHDDVVGLVHLKRALAVPPAQRQLVRAAELMVDVPAVPESLPLGELLETLRGRGFQMAVVVDEYGGTAGLLTLEDVVEELVGDITDEHDRAIDSDQLRPDGTWLLPGTLRPDEIAELTGVQLPESAEYETVAGLVISELGEIPEPGQTITLPATLAPDRSLAPIPEEIDDAGVEADADESVPRAVRVRLTVVTMDRHRVADVRLSAVGTAQDGPES